MGKSFPWQKAAAIAGVAGFALLILPSLVGGKKEGEGSESGGFQIPDFFPQSPGAVAAPAGTTNYNISFPDFPGFPGETKKESVPSGVGSLGVPYTGFGYDAKSQVYTSGIGSGVPGYEPLKSVSHAPLTNTTKKQSVQATGISALKANITTQPTYGQTSSGGGKSTGGMGTTKKSYVAGKTSHAYKR